MNFLNSATVDYPDAISFAPGRPYEGLFDVAGGLASIDQYVAHRADTAAIAEERVRADLGQYQPTTGSIGDLIARQLANDEGIVVDPDAVLVTVGAQEAMLIVLLGLFEPGRDVLLCSDPSYIGMAGPAALLGIEVAPVPSGPCGLEPRAVEEVLREVRSRGRVPRGLYDVPDFNNPLGSTMPRAAREELLALAEREELVLIEDNAYGMFAYDGDPEPTLMALDRRGVVLYVGSVAKTVFPGLRVGYLVAGQRCVGGGPLSAQLAKVKSLTTVSTPAVTQAILAGILLEHDCSLRRYVQPKVDFYRGNRDRMLRRLAEAFAAPGAGGAVTWNRPRGGFFLTVELPFVFDAACLRVCARDFGVVVCPMSFFAMRPGREHQVRLSFSYVDHRQIDEGVDRLAAFVRYHLSVRSSPA